MFAFASSMLQFKRITIMSKEVYEIDLHVGIGGLDLQMYIRIELFMFAFASSMLQSKRTEIHVKRDLQKRPTCRYMRVGITCVYEVGVVDVCLCVEHAASQKRRQIRQKKKENATTMLKDNY